jgi:hypothetical protein
VTATEGHAKSTSHSSMSVGWSGSNLDHTNATGSATARRTVIAPALGTKRAIKEAALARLTARAATQIAKPRIAHRMAVEAKAGRLSHPRTPSTPKSEAVPGQAERTVAARPNDALAVGAVVIRDRSVSQVKSN